MSMYISIRIGVKDSVEMLTKQADNVADVVLNQLCRVFPVGLECPFVMKMSFLIIWLEAASIMHYGGFFGGRISVAQCPSAPKSGHGVCRVFT